MMQLHSFSLRIMVLSSAASEMSSDLKISNISSNSVAVIITFAALFLKFLSIV